MTGTDNQFLFSQSGLKFTPVDVSLDPSDSFTVTLVPSSNVVVMIDPTNGSGLLSGQFSMTWQQDGDPGPPCTVGPFAVHASTAPFGSSPYSPQTHAVTAVDGAPAVPAAQGCRVRRRCERTGPAPGERGGVSRAGEHHSATGMDDEFDVLRRVAERADHDSHHDKTAAPEHDAAACLDQHTSTRGEQPPCRRAPHDARRRRQDAEEDRDDTAGNRGTRPNRSEYGLLPVADGSAPDGTREHRWSERDEQRDRSRTAQCKRRHVDDVRDRRARVDHRCDGRCTQAHRTRHPRSAPRAFATTVGRTGRRTASSGGHESVARSEILTNQREIAARVARRAFQTNTRAAIDCVASPASRAYLHGRAAACHTFVSRLTNTPIERGAQCRSRAT